MFFSFGKKEPLLDENTAKWMFETFAWALRNFGQEAFNASQLVNPSNQHFPGRANSVDEMATMIFDRVIAYAGMQHWPVKLMNEELINGLPPAPQIQIQGQLRRFDNALRVSSESTNPIVIGYHPLQINDPEVLIGSYAHALAHYLGTSAVEVPPGGEQNWPHVTELLSVFMGFGIIMANSAYTNKVRSCGSCAGPIVERMNFLSQYDLTYALAVFCSMKNISNKAVLPYLKKSLHSYYKKSMKDIASREKQFSLLALTAS